MNTYTWKLSNKKLNKTNLYLYSNFIKRNYKIDLGNDDWIRLGKGFTIECVVRPEEDKWIKIKVCSSALKSINKFGISAVLKKAKEKGTLSI